MHIYIGLLGCKRKYVGLAFYTHNMLVVVGYIAVMSFGWRRMTTVLAFTFRSNNN